MEQDEWVPPELFPDHLADGDGRQGTPPGAVRLGHLCPGLRDAQPAAWTARTADLRTAPAGGLGQVTRTALARWSDWGVRAVLGVRSGHQDCVCWSGKGLGSRDEATICLLTSLSGLTCPLRQWTQFTLVVNSKIHTKQLNIATGKTSRYKCHAL